MTLGKRINVARRQFHREGYKQGTAPSQVITTEWCWRDAILTTHI